MNVKSARKLTDPTLDNPARPSTSVAAKSGSNGSRSDGRIAARVPALITVTDPRLDTSTNRPRPQAVFVTNDARLDNRLGAKAPASKSATADVRIDTRPRDKELNVRPVSRDPSRPGK
jgi:hypothetical protein